MPGNERPCSRGRAIDEPATPDFRPLGGGEIAPREARENVLETEDITPLRIIDHMGFLDLPVPYPRPRERGEVPPETQALAQIMRERPDVCPGIAANRENDCWIVILADFALENGGLPRLELHVFATLCLAVGACPADMHGRERRGHLLDFPEKTVGDERLDPRSILRRTLAGFRLHLRDHPFAVVRRAHGTERDGGEILFRETGEELDDLECLGTDREDEEPFGHRIECSEMPDFRIAERSAQPCHHVMARGTAWLLEEEETVTHWRKDNNKPKVCPINTQNGEMVKLLNG